jgi:hypothetical protein
MVTKNERGQEGNSSSGRVYLRFERAVLSGNNLFLFPLDTALLIGDVMMKRQSGVKMFLSAITAPIVLAHLIDLIRRCYVNPLQI